MSTKNAPSGERGATPIFIQQRDATDCGVACLLSIIRMYGGDASLETLREQSGTSLQGTSLLGLQQVAEKMGINAEAFEVEDIEEFKKEATFPCILHVVIDEKLEHYVVCNGFSVRKATSHSNRSNISENNINEVTEYNITDPAKGFDTWEQEELLKNWKSRAVLILKPTEAFEKVSQSKFKKIAWIKELVKEDVPLLSIAVVLGIIMAVLGMATALFSQRLIDEILPKHQNTKLWLGVAILGILLIATGGLGYIRNFFLLRQSKDFNNRLMDDFYEKLMYLPKTFFDGRKTGEIIARLNDTRRIQSVISFLVGNVVIDILVFVISSGFLFYYSWQIGILAMMAIPMFGWLIWKYNQRIIIAQKAVMTQYATTESHFFDAISGIGTIKAGNKEPFFTKIGKLVYSFFQEQIYQLGTLGNRYGLWNEVFNALLVTSILAFASFMVLQNQLKIGEMMAVLSIAMGLVGAIARLATTNIQLQEAIVAFDRMYEFAYIKTEKATEKEIATIQFESVNSLSINNLSFRFPGKSQLLKDVSLEINKGKINILSGEVGSGKSIFLQILQKFQSLETGEIIINNTIDLQQVKSSIWRKHIGVVPQEIKIFTGTLLDNIILGNVSEEAEKTIEFCKKYGFDSYFENFPQGYMTIVGEDGVNLSGGQRQLVALARALYPNPSFLLLDEPTSAMDSKTEDFVLGLLVKLKEEKAILLVTHRKSTFDIADNIIELREGKTKNLSKSESANLIIY
jgi:ATP-binding cassette, subfamily C, bacteriocin exporter